MLDNTTNLLNEITQKAANSEPVQEIAPAFLALSHAVADELKQVLTSNNVEATLSSALHQLTDALKTGANALTASLEASAAPAAGPAPTPKTNGKKSGNS